MLTKRMLLPRIIPILLLIASAVRGAEQTEIDNPWVRVLRVKLDAHEKTAPAQHPETVRVFITGGELRITDGARKSTDERRKPGDVRFAQGGTLTFENPSADPIEFALIDLKTNAPKPVSPPITLDPVKLDPKHHIVVLENNRVRVLHTILEPHVKSPLHQHPPYVVVYVTGLHTTMKLADGKLIDNRRKPGEIAWRDALTHQTENIDDRAAFEIQVELK